MWPGCGFLLLLFSGVNAVDYSYKEFYFDQVIDHFNVYWKSLGQETYKQRYLLADQWWHSTEQGPILFYTGNEGDITTFWNNTGFMFEIAPQLGAMIIFAEHRYYGKSLPFGDRSFQHPYIDYLSAEQALADYAVLITHLKQQYSALQSPVIAFGGSYGGMLSAYMRFHYPNVISGSIAASAPILVVTGQSPRENFFEDVTKDFRDAAPSCFDAVKSAFSVIANLAMAGDPGLKNISSTFGLCKQLASSADYRHLIGWLRNAFTTMAMMDYPYATSFMSKLPANPVKVACQKILAGNILTGMASVMDMVYGFSGSLKCHDLDLEYIECGDPTGCGLGSDSLAWDYQVCTEFIMPAGTNNVTDMFPVLPYTLSQRDEYCMKRWGIKPRNDWPAISFWGKDIKSSSNIVFSNGLLDPWCRGGVLTNVSESVVAILIEGGAHHLDLRASNPADPESVVQARQLELKYVMQWIKQAGLRSRD